MRPRRSLPRIRCRRRKNASLAPCLGRHRRIASALIARHHPDLQGAVLDLALNLLHFLAASLGRAICLGEHEYKVSAPAGHLGKIAHQTVRYGWELGLDAWSRRELNSESPNSHFVGPL